MATVEFLVNSVTSVAVFKASAGGPVFFFNQAIMVSVCLPPTQDDKNIIIIGDTYSPSCTLHAIYRYIQAVFPP